MPGAITREELAKELEVINRSVQGKKCLAEADDIKDIVGSKQNYFAVMKELYNFICKCDIQLLPMLCCPMYWGYTRFKKRK